MQKSGYAKHAVSSGRSPSPITTTHQSPTMYVSPTNIIKTTTTSTLHTATHIVPPPRKKRKGKIVVGDDRQRSHTSASLSSSSFVKRQAKSKNKLFGACICA